MQNKMTKRLINIVAVIIGFLFVVSTVLTLLSGILYFCLLNKDFYISHISDEDYLSDVKAYAAQDITEECYYYGIDASTIIACINDQTLKELSLEYIEGLYLFFDGKGEMPDVNYPADDFFPAVNAHYTALGDINPEEDQALAEIFAGRVDSNLNTMTNLTIVTNIFKSSAADTVRDFTQGFWKLAGISTGLLIGYILIKKNRILEWARSVVGLLAVAAVFTFIPVWCLKIFDLPSKLVLMDSPLKTLLDALIYKSVGQTFEFLAIVSAVIALLLVALSVATAITTSKRILAAKQESEQNEATITDVLPQE